MPNLRLHSLAYPVTALGPGRRLAMWVSGCSLNCRGCISPELQSPKSGKDITTERLLDHILSLQESLDGLSLTGGEPFEQASALSVLLEDLRQQRPDWNILAFSGYPLSMIAGLKTLDILKNSKSKYEFINKQGTNLLKGLNKFFTENEYHILATGYKSLIMLHALSEWIENPTIDQIISLTDKKKEALLQLALFNREIVGLHGIGALSMAHSETHIKKLQKMLVEVSPHITSFK